MFKRIQIKNVGRLKDINVDGLKDVVIVFGKNGSGKTTFSRIFYCFNNGTITNFIAGLNEESIKQCCIIKEGDNKSPKVVFYDGEIKHTVPQNLFDSFVVFNKDFINENIYIGEKVEQYNKENLYEFIAGKEQIELKNYINDLAKQETKLREEIKDYERKLDEKGINKNKLDIPKSLSSINLIEKRRQEIISKLNSLDYIEEIKTLQELKQLTFDKEINEVIRRATNILRRGIEDIHERAEDLKKSHFSKFPNLEKDWFEAGLEFIKTHNPDLCPMCEQPISDNEFIKTLIEGISKEYEAFIKEINELEIQVDDLSLVKVWEIDKRNKELYVKWKKHIKDLPDLYDLEPTSLEKGLNTIKRKLIESLKNKKIQLTKSIELQVNVEQFISIFTKYNSSIERINQKILRFKQEVYKSEKEKDKLQKELQELDYITKLLQNKGLIENYKKLKEELNNKEQERKSKQNELEEKIKATMNKYETTINKCLEDFGADFRIKEVIPEKSKGHGKRGKHKVEYCINLENIDRSLKLENAMKYALSEGDKTTLAFAFFISKFIKNTDEESQDLIVVIDDPISSLDMHRIRKTVEYIYQHILKQVKQCFILTHNEMFFEELYNKIQSEVSKKRFTRETCYYELRKTPKVSYLEEMDPIRKIEENKTYLLALRALKEYIYDNKTNFSLKEIRDNIRIAVEFYLKKKYYPDFEDCYGIGKIIDKAKGRASSNEELKNRYKFILENIDDLYKLSEFSSESHHSKDIYMDDNEIIRHAKLALKILES